MSQRGQTLSFLTLVFPFLIKRICLTCASIMLFLYINEALFGCLMDPREVLAPKAEHLGQVSNAHLKMTKSWVTRYTPPRVT